MASHIQLDVLQYNLVVQVRNPLSGRCRMVARGCHNMLLAALAKLQKCGVALLQTQIDRVAVSNLLLPVALCLPLVCPSWPLHNVSLCACVACSLQFYQPSSISPLPPTSYSFLNQLTVCEVSMPSQPSRIALDESQGFHFKLI